MRWLVGAVVAAVGLQAVDADAAADLRFGASKILLLFEDSGGVSDDVAKADRPVAANGPDGRSVQLVVDVIVEGEPNAEFQDPPTLYATARTRPEGAVLFEKAWPIRSIGNFGTAMRSFIVDHGCAGLEVTARIEEAGQVIDTWSKTVDITCGP
ncbi:hypothetical protein [Chthonobacter rhizosphaerae]|uniref:hypothetical protein n=1 Tax=Chthonobacter rhizosphaerae TaxID=2735553 RepID=UPI0015EEF2E5|nr:hypothetical protein [Chthonobacter rhizosphaerae]